jgi:hypothetical protein
MFKRSLIAVCIENGSLVFVFGWANVGSQTFMRSRRRLLLQVGITAASVSSSSYREREFPRNQLRAQRYHGFDRMWFRHFSEIDAAEFIADVNA